MPKTEDIIIRRGLTLRIYKFVSKDIQSQLLTRPNKPCQPDLFQISGLATWRFYFAMWLFVSAAWLFTSAVWHSYLSMWRLYSAAWLSFTAALRFTSAVQLTNRSVNNSAFHTIFQYGKLELSF